MSMQTDLHYISMLKEEYQERRRRRPAYSERAFARDIRVSPGFINLLFRKQRTLSATKGYDIAQRLNWELPKINAFVESIQKASLTAAQKTPRPQRRFKRTPYRDLELDIFEHISDLRHVAAMTLVTSREIHDAEEVAQALNISVADAGAVLQRLTRVGILEFDGGKYVQRPNGFEVKKVPSEAIRRYHRETLRVAEEAIEGQEHDKRGFSSMTVAFDPKRVLEAKEFITKFLKAFERKFGKEPEGEVYQLNTQLFSLKKGTR